VDSVDGVDLRRSCVRARLSAPQRSPRRRLTPPPLPPPAVPAFSSASRASRSAAGSASLAAAANPLPKQHGAEHRHLGEARHAQQARLGIGRARRLARHTRRAVQHEGGLDGEGAELGVVAVEPEGGARGGAHGGPAARAARGRVACALQEMASLARPASTCRRLFMSSLKQKALKRTPRRAWRGWRGEGGGGCSRCARVAYGGTGRKERALEERGARGKVGARARVREKQGRHATRGRCEARDVAVGAPKCGGACAAVELRGAIFAKEPGARAR
jgi:hypothetical protein